MARVAAARRAELTECTSLIRCLRTNHILDVSRHLCEHAQKVADEEARVRPDANRNRIPRKIIDRPLWSHWPLLLVDLSKPLWGLEEEAAFIASQVCRSPTEPPSAIEDVELDIDDIELPPYYQFIGMSATTFLEDTLDLLASQVPALSGKYQKDFRALDWRSVLDIIKTFGDPEMVDEQMLNNVKERMKALLKRRKNTNRKKQPSYYLPKRIKEGRRPRPYNRRGYFKSRNVNDTTKEDSEVISTSSDDSEGTEEPNTQERYPVHSYPATVQPDGTWTNYLDLIAKP